MKVLQYKYSNTIKVCLISSHSAAASKGLKFMHHPIKILRFRSHLELRLDLKLSNV